VVIALIQGVLCGGMFWALGLPPLCGQRHDSRRQSHDGHHQYRHCSGRQYSIGNGAGTR
jgi:hypothetical protein